MPTWAGLLKPKGLRLGPLKSTYNAEHYAGYGGLSLVVLTLLAVKMRVAAQNHEKNSIKPFILAFKVIQNHCFRCQLKGHVRLHIGE